MTDQVTDHAAEIIRDLAQASTEPSPLEPGGIYAWIAGGQVHKIDLTGDEYRDNPRRKRGLVPVTDVASFAHYYAKHADGDSEVFADLDDGTIAAVLDAHHPAGGEARWQGHRVILRLVPTPQWVTWTRSDRKMMGQQEFAEFIEDNIGDVAPDGPCTGADLLEIAQQFQAHTKVSFKSGSRLASGETQFTYQEEIDARAGQRGTIGIPAAFELGLKVFGDSEAYRVRARFRYRLADGALRLGYHLDDPAGQHRDAVLQVVAKAQEATGATVMRGRPA